MSEQEKAALLATEIMGWHVYDFFGEQWYENAEKNKPVRVNRWWPDIDVEQALMVAERLRSLGWNVTIDLFAHRDWQSGNEYGGTRYRCVVDAATEALWQIQRKALGDSAYAKFGGYMDILPAAMSEAFVQVAESIREAREKEGKGE